MNNRTCQNALQWNKPHAGLLTLFITASAGYFAAGAVDLLAAANMQPLMLRFGIGSGAATVYCGFTCRIDKTQSLCKRNALQDLTAGRPGQGPSDIVAEQDGPQPFSPKRINNILSVQIIG